MQLSRYSLDISYILDLILLQDLYGHWLPSVLVDGLLHLPERPLPDRLPHLGHKYSMR